MYDYVKHLRWAKLRVGLVVSIALAVIFLAVMFAGNIEKMFTPRSDIYAVFNDVKGLREGSPVWFSGVEIGSVKSIKFTPQQDIRVRMSIISDSLKYLKRDSTANILTIGLLGDKYIEISPGSTGAESLRAEDTIRGTSHVEIQELVETGRESIAGLSELVIKLDKLIVKIESGRGTVTRLLTDPSIYDNLNKATEELTDLVKRIKSSRGTLGRLLNEDDVYSDIASSAEDIKAFSEKLRASRGTLNKFIEDERLYENINEASGKLNRLLEKVEAGKGVAGSLVNDEELTTELKTTLKELNSLIKDIRKHPEKYFRFSVF
ncbi:MAG: MCE family protein [Deferribacteres bacterium]|nr:MCE family protein [Deferribacteres bacterium]